MLTTLRFRSILRAPTRTLGLLPSVLALLFLASLVAAPGVMASGGTSTSSGAPASLVLFDSGEILPGTTLSIGAYLGVAVIDAPPSTVVDFVLRDESGQVIAQATAKTDAAGFTGPHPLWRQVAPAGSADPALLSFATHQEAASGLSGRVLVLSAAEASSGVQLDSTLIDFETAREVPRVFYANALDQPVEILASPDVYVGGYHAAPLGTVIQLWVVDRRPQWSPGALMTLRGQTATPQWVTLGAGTSNFLVKVHEMQQGEAIQVFLRPGANTEPFLGLPDQVLFSAGDWPDNTGSGLSWPSMSPEEGEGEEGSSPSTPPSQTQ